MQVYVNYILVVFVVFTPLIIHPGCLGQIINFILILEAIGKIQFVAI